MRNEGSSRRWVFLPVALLLTGAPSVVAQSDRGRISGLVKDESGAPVPDVSVTVTNAGTNAVTETTTNSEGFYSVPNLPIGVYFVRFSLEGFTTYTREGIEVGLAEAVRLDHTLTVGTVRDAVTVRADTDLLDTSNPEVGTSMTSPVVTDLPLDVAGGRALEHFAYAIAPSVEGNNWTSLINGSAPFTKEVVLDGTSAVIQVGGHIGESSPPMEAVEEFTVQTSGIPAEYGRTAGGVFNFSLKSGTNELRGSVYGFLRNEALNANTWQNNFLAGSDPENAEDYERERDRHYVFGASLGGPIIKDRTFFFAAVEEYQVSNFLLGGFTQTVPTERMLSGDFSELLDVTAAPLGTDAGGQPIYPGAIFDPGTGLVFPGNVIPPDRHSAVSRQIVGLYRQGYLPKVDRIAYNSALPYTIPEFKQHQFSVKLTHRFSNASQLTGSFIWTQRPRTVPGEIWDPDDPDGMGGPLGGGGVQDVGSRQLRLSHSLTVSPNVINVANFTYSRFTNPFVSASADGGWPQELGFEDTGDGSFPFVWFGEAVNGIATSSIGAGGSSSGYKGEVFIASDSLSWVTGRHLLKLGGEFRHLRLHSWQPAGGLGFVFSPVTTGVVGQPWSNQVGFGFASFLLGDVDWAYQVTPGDLTGRRDYVALYAQDDWRVSDSLTLNLGLRWETTGPWTEKDGHWANFDTSVLNPTTGIPGALVFAENGDTSFEGPRDWSQFGPRLGLTWTPSERWVVRGAYGIFYQPIGMDYWAGVPYGFAPGYQSTNEVTQVGYGVPAFNWDDGYPGVEVPGVKDPNWTQWGVVRMSPEGLKAGRTQQWNAGVEYQLTPDLVLGATYVGNVGSRLPSGELQRNQPDMEALGALHQRGQEWAWVWDETSAAAAGVPYPYPGFSNFAFMTLAPYPTVAEAWGPIRYVGSPLGRSDYNALQLTLTKRMSHGLAGSMAYTLSRSHGNVQSGFQERWSNEALQDVNLRDAEAGVIGFNDRTHVLKGYVAWELPFGRGRRWMDRGGWLDAVLGGWQLSVIFRYMSGTPLAITSSNWYAGWSSHGYPIYVSADPNGSYDVQFEGHFDATDPGAAGNLYFDPGNFSNPPYGEFGEGPGRFEQLRGFGFAGEDLGLMKTFTFGERYRLQVRLELLNVFNRHYYSDPVTDMASPYFGYVTSVTGQPRQGQLGIRFEF